MPAERTLQEGTPAPEAELLEFLGSWQTATGEWPESPAAAEIAPLRSGKPVESETGPEEPNRE